MNGSHLERYSQRFNCVEINSSFYREHQPTTYLRWRDTVPDSFKFSVKLSKVFSHERMLKGPGKELETSVRAIQSLGPKLGCLLIQLPAKLNFSQDSTHQFFSRLRDIYDGPIALEPRGPTWAKTDALEILQAFRLSKVLADPEPCPLKRVERLSFEAELRYFRLHGTPHRYRSSYETERLLRVAKAIVIGEATTLQTWCIFDNTAYGAATSNALELDKILRCDN